MCAVKFKSDKASIFASRFRTTITYIGLVGTRALRPTCRPIQDLSSYYGGPFVLQDLLSGYTVHLTY